MLTTLRTPSPTSSQSFCNLASVELSAMVDDPASLDHVAELCGDLSLPWTSLSEKQASMEVDQLTAYFQRLRHVKPLTVEEQQRLAERYVEEEDVNAGKLLVLTNLRLVVKLAREYARRWSDLLDLIQEGNVGLAEAVTRYNPYRGVRFTSYAQYWIRAMILNYLMNHLYPVKLGSSRAGRKLFYNLKKARRALIRQGHERPTPEMIAAYLEVDEDDVVRIGAQLDGPPVFLDAQLPGEDGTTVGDLMRGDGVSPEDAAERIERIKMVRQLIQEFGDQIDDGRKRAIWFERVVKEEPKHLADLGNDWGVSKERIRQVEAEVRDDFKHFLYQKFGREAEDELLCG